MPGKHAIQPRRRWPRRLLIATNVVVAIAILATASAYAYVQYRLDQVQRVLKVPDLAPVGSPDPTSQSPKDGADDGQASVPLPPFTMLVIGSDTRNLGSASNPAFGTDQAAGGQRSDSILLLRVVPDLHALGIFSIPRDTLVSIPSMGTTRINAAFDSGNPSLLVQVLKQDFGIQVNHVAEFNFATFDDIANALGGVYQWFPTPARDLDSDLVIGQPGGHAPGCVLLNGPTALAFARSREYQYYLDGEWHSQLFPESDLGRIQRQQAFVKLAAEKAQRIAPTNPLALNRLIGSVTQNIKLDTGFSNSLIVNLIRDYRSANLGDIPSYTYPTSNSTSVSGALQPDTALGKQTIQQWLTVGTPAPKATSTTSVAPPTGLGQPATTTTTIAPSEISVEVVNGSGESNQALNAANALQAAGYNTSDQGDIAFSHAPTVIRYAPDSKADARQLRAALDGRPKLVRDPVLTDSPYNVEVVTGADWDALAAKATTSGGLAPTTTTTSTTTTTTLPPLTSSAFVGTKSVQADSSSYYKGQYIPPGRVAGQKPQTCPQ